MVSRLLLGSMLVAGLVGSSVASAADITRTHTLVIDASGTQDFGDKFDASTKSKSFDDFFSFTVGGTSDLTSALISVKGKFQDLNITGFNLIPSAGSMISGTSLTPGGGALDAWSIDASAIAPGSYQLEVLGTVVGAGGSFGGNINVSPVPEPGSMGMMVAGLGLLGVAMSRRKKRSDSFSA